MKEKNRHKTIKTDLKARGVYFSEKLPAYNQVLKSFENDLFFKENRRNASKANNEQRKNSRSYAKKPMVVCDRKLQHRKEVKLWLKNYPVYFVSGGEQLKTLENFSKHINGLLRKTKDENISGFISLGGGSVGDFTGFLASVYKRGTPLVHIPTTWLSALDSAHGGKTALNIGQVKNMLGSYCFPKAVFIVKEMFSSLPKLEKESAKGELIKISLIEGGELYKKCFKKKWSEDIWSFLPQAVLAKMKIVEKDPYEKKGYRQQLNLGHTLGHVLESYFGLAHGKAVMYGLVFTLWWSHSRFTLSPSFLKDISFLMRKKPQLNFYLKNLPDRILRKILLQDKKRVDNQSIQFIFLKNPGKVFSENVSMKEIITEIQRQR